MGTSAGLDTAFERLARRHVGGVVGLLDLDGDGPEVRSWGRTGRPEQPVVDEHTLFEFGSVTKTVTALALAVLVEDGTVRLDTPLRELLPAGTDLPGYGTAEITLEHLARHRSRLPHSPDSFAHVLRVVLRGGNPYDLTEAAVLEKLAGMRLRRAPGTGGLHYSNLGAGLLGIALRRAAGAADYADLVQRTVLKPLGLTDTTVRPGPGQQDRMARGHRSRRRPAIDWYLEGIAGAGALRSTVPELLRYLRAQLEPETTALTEAIRRTHQPLEPERRNTIGLGWMRTRMRGGELWWHNGATGGFRAFAAFSPQRRRAVAIVVNDVRSPDMVGIQLTDLADRG